MKKIYISINNKNCNDDVNETKSPILPLVLP